MSHAEFPSAILFIFLQSLSLGWGNFLHQRFLFLLTFLSCLFSISYECKKVNLISSLLSFFIGSSFIFFFRCDPVVSAVNLCWLFFSENAFFLVSSSIIVFIYFFFHWVLLETFQAQGLNNHLILFPFHLLLLASSFLVVIFYVSHFRKICFFKEIKDQNFIFIFHIFDVKD